MGLQKAKMNYFLVFFCFFWKNPFGKIFDKKQKCMKNYTKIWEIVEKFTVPLAFLGKSVILRVYLDADFPVAIVILDMY